MLDGSPDLRIDVEDMFGAGDKVAVRVRIRGTRPMSAGPLTP
ncbi:hypothetical protein AB0B13_08150 [Streptomyces sp. NPDC042898]